LQRSAGFSVPCTRPYDPRANPHAHARDAKKSVGIARNNQRASTTAHKNFQAHVIVVNRDRALRAQRMQCVRRARCAYALGDASWRRATVIARVRTYVKNRVAGVLCSVCCARLLHHAPARRARRVPVEPWRTQWRNEN